MSMGSNLMAKGPNSQNREIRAIGAKSVMFAD